MTTTTPTTTTTSDAKAPPNTHVRAAVSNLYYQTAEALAKLADEQSAALRALLKTMEKVKDQEAVIHGLREWFEANGLERPHAVEEHSTEYELSQFNKRREQLGPFVEHHDSLAAAARTLIGMGWSHDGGEKWSPPSPMPAPVNIGIDLGTEHKAEHGRADGSIRIFERLSKGALLESDSTAPGGIRIVLPDEQPEDPEPEGTADDLRPLIESPARRLTLTFTHPTIGDGIFTTELLKAIGEFTLYMAKVELPSDPYEAPAEPRYPFTASNGVVVDVLAWKTVDDMGGLPSSPFMTGEEQLDRMTAVIREAAQAIEGLHGVRVASDKAMLQASAERITGIYSAVEAGVKDVAMDPATISVAMVRGEVAAPRAVVHDLTQETPVEPSSNRGVQGVGDSPTQVVYDFEQFIAYGCENTPGPICHGMAWAFNFHGHAVTHENDSRYLIEGNSPGADMLIFNRGDILTVSRDNGHISIKSPSTPDALDLGDISAQALDTLKVPMSVAAQTEIIKPTIGRRVWFWPARNSGSTGFVCHDIAVPMDAGIVFVHSDRCVNLDVCDHGGNHHAFTSVHLDQGDDCPRDPDAARCEWMPYQKGQASKGGK